MHSNDIRKSVSYRLFLFDTFFNWFLGILLLFFYRSFEDIIGNKPLLPEVVWIGIGSGLILFSIWQTYIVILKKFGRSSLIFGCITAWIPFLMLTYALIFMDFALKVDAKVFIWIGDLYMFILGLFYYLKWSKLRKKT